jgi:outer membrane protein OmpA-like peptidoglycan-associated protein
MKHYLHGTAQGEAASTPASRSLTLLKNIRDVSAQLGAGLMSGSLQETLDSDGRQAVFNNVSKLYWDAVKSDMPEAMHAAGELYYGIYSTKETLTAVKNLQTPKLANVGWRHLFRAKIFDSSKAAGSALATIMDAHMGNRRLVAGRVADAWFSKGASAGLNVFGTATTGIDLYKKAKAHSKSKENTVQREKNTHEVAEDYLEQIPVWKTNAEYQPDMLDKALQKAREKSGGEISANFVNDARGGGIRIVYDFNATEIESKTNQPVLEELTVALDELLKDESNLIVEIEGHACQVDTEENNMKVAAERAEKAKAMLLSKSTIFKDRIKLSVFGETKPLYVPKDGEKVDRHNQNLRQNRRVEIRIYMQSLSVIFNASRYGSKAMERSRLALETAMKNEDNLDAELRMAVFDSAVDIASYIPLFAPYARGYLLAKESTKSLVSAVKLIDYALLDSYLDDLDKMHDVKRELERLSNIHIELLNKLRRTNIALETEVGTYQELITHLESEEARQELLKRYELRALAMNGLILLLADLGIMARASSSPLSYFVERYKVKQYIETYVLRDDWSVRTIKGNTLAANWKHRCSQDYYAQQVKAIPDGARYWPMPSNHRLSGDYYSKLRLENVKASGAFNRVFPVQTMLFDHPDESMFENFTQYFNPQSRELDEEAIGFCRILIQSARYDATDNPPWQTYQEWESSSESGRIGPFDKVKVQLILHKAHQYAQTVTIGYDRVDGSNIQGPAFTDWMLPMKAGDFEADPHGDIKSFYATQGAETLIAIEHTPSYRFGDVMIDGLKPLTSKARLVYHTAITTLAKANSAIASSTDAYFTETDAFQRYVLGGGFSHMAYCLAVRKRDGKHSYYLPLNFKFGEDFSDAKDELSVGGLHTETKSVLLDTYMGEQQLLLREKDLLLESFTLITDKANQNSIPLLHGIKEQVFAIETESTGIHLFEEDGWRSSPPVLWRKGFSWGNRGKQDPASIYMMLLGENYERTLYEQLRMRWDGVSMAMQLQLEGNDGDSFKGPMYYSSMYHIGEFVHRNDTWQLAYSHSNRHQSEIDDMSCFLEQAIQKLENDNNLDKNKPYTMYCMKFDLEYVSPTGVRVKGLRPFGGVIGGKAELKLSVANLKQVGLQGGEEYESRLKGAVYLPSLFDDKALADNYFSNAPWLVEKESIDPLVDKTTAETWKQYDETKRKKWLKDWIEKQPTVALSPKPLESSLGDPD